VLRAGRVFPILNQVNPERSSEMMFAPQWSHDGTIATCSALLGVVGVEEINLG